jgi:hypothetical protein
VSLDLSDLSAGARDAASDAKLHCVAQPAARVDGTAFRVLNMSYTIHWSRFGVNKKFSGHVTTKELLKSLTEVQSHPDYESYKFAITDFLEVESIDFVEREMLMYGAHAVGGGYLNAQLVIGIVVTNTDIIDVLKSRYEKIVKYPVGYFSSLDDCNAWILEKTGVTVRF